MASDLVLEAEAHSEWSGALLKVAELVSGRAGAEFRSPPSPCFLWQEIL